MHTYRRSGGKHNRFAIGSVADSSLFTHCRFLFRFPNFQTIHLNFKWSLNTYLDLVAPDLSDADPELNATVIDDKNLIDLP